MLASIVTLVLMRALLEGLPALLIFGLLLLPMAAMFGINPLQYGIVMIIAMGLGAFSPPIGVGMFVTCSICDTSMENVARHMALYLAVLVIGLLVVAFVPWFSLIVPNVMGNDVKRAHMRREGRAIRRAWPTNRIDGRRR